MKSEVLPRIESTALRAETETDGRTMTAHLVGDADTRTRPELAAFFDALHAEAERTRAHEVRVDLRALEFMNSSCFKDLLSWIGKIQRNPEDRRYRVTLLSDPQRYWQKRSLGALISFAPEIVIVQT